MSKPVKLAISRQTPARVNKIAKHKTAKRTKRVSMGGMVRDAVSGDPTHRGKSHKNVKMSAGKKPRVKSVQFATGKRVYAPSVKMASLSACCHLAVSKGGFRSETPTGAQAALSYNESFDRKPVSVNTSGAKKDETDVIGEKIAQKRKTADVIGETGLKRAMMRVRSGDYDNEEHGMRIESALSEANQGLLQGTIDSNHESLKRERTP